MLVITLKDIIGISLLGLVILFWVVFFLYIRLYVCIENKKNNRSSKE